MQIIGPVFWVDDHLLGLEPENRMEIFTHEGAGIIASGLGGVDDCRGGGQHLTNALIESGACVIRAPRIRINRNWGSGYSHLEALELARGKLSLTVAPETGGPPAIVPPPEVLQSRGRLAFILNVRSGN